MAHRGTLTRQLEPRPKSCSFTCHKLIQRFLYCRIAPSAKYGDESVYFDLKDIEQTAGAWDLYGVESSKRYPDRQVCALDNHFN